MAWDVVATPVETRLPAADFDCEFFLDDVHRVSFVTQTSHILNVDEDRSADVPDSCRHHQGRHPAAEEGHSSTEQRVGQEDEGREQQQSPTPGQFDEVSAKDEKEFTLSQVVKFNFKALYGINALVKKWKNWISHSNVIIKTKNTSLTLKCLIV